MGNNYTVYMHVNKINDKKYIGITSQPNPKIRWKNGAGYKKCCVFWKAIEKYGWDNFEHIILFNGLSKTEAEAKEAELISLYHSNNGRDGYNVENGGVIHKLSEAQKEHLRQVNIGKKHTEETKRKMSETHKGNQYCLGHKQSEETKEKRAKKLRGALSGSAVEVYQYDLNGNLVKRWDCMVSAVKALNLNSSSHISDCCRGKRAAAYGYMWSYRLENKKPYFKGNKREVFLNAV